MWDILCSNIYIYSYFIISIYIYIYTSLTSLVTLYRFSTWIFQGGSSFGWFTCNSQSLGLPTKNLLRVAWKIHFHPEFFHIPKRLHKVKVISTIISNPSTRYRKQQMEVYSLYCPKLKNVAMRFFELAQLGSFATLRSICPDENQSWSLLKVCFFFGGCWVIFITQVQRDMEGTTLFSTLWGVVLKHVHKTDFDRLILKCEHLIFWSCYRLSTVKVRPWSTWPIMSHPVGLCRDEGRRY